MEEVERVYESGFERERATRDNEIRRVSTCTLFSAKFQCRGAKRDNVIKEMESTISELRTQVAKYLAREVGTTLQYAPEIWLK